MLKNEFFCLLGPSVCGKTTTLRCIAGTLKPTKGEIYIDEERVTHVPPQDRGCAMVFQFYVMFKDLDPFDQIAFPLKMHKVPMNEIKKKVTEIAEVLGIKDILHTPVEKLTVEQQQKIALARALVSDAKLYLLDEPLTNLDAKIRAKMRQTLEELKKKCSL